MFRRNSRPACAGTLLALLLASGALAQTAGRQVAAPVNTYSYVLDQISVFAARGEKQLLDVPQTVTVIGRSEMDQRTAVSC